VRVPGLDKPILRTYDPNDQKPETLLPFAVEDTAIRQAHVATAVSTVYDGAKEGDTEGKLLYRGYNVKELVEKTSYEEVSYLLLNGSLPRLSDLGEFKSQLAQKAVLTDEVQTQLKGALKSIKVDEKTNPMSLMSALVAIMDANENLPIKGEENRYQSTLRTLAVMPTLIGLVNAHMHGKLEEFSFPKAEDFGDKGIQFSYAKLLMKSLNPEMAEDAGKVSALDKYLILHAEHGLNLSTATARIVDSGEAKEGGWRITLGAMQSLAGSRHGNASNDALTNLKNILRYNKGQGSIEERVDAYIADVDAAKVAKKDKKPFLNQLDIAMDGTVEGLGHKIYKAKDPRASVLQKILADFNGNSDLYKVATTLEKKLAAHKDFGRKHETSGGKNIFPNVDFCSGVLLTQYLGVDERLMTSMFAIGRNVGWHAHAAENARHAGNITRPEAIALTPEVTEPIKPLVDRTSPPTQMKAAMGNQLFADFKKLMPLAV
jgi:citrate synthase